MSEAAPHTLSVVDADLHQLERGINRMAASARAQLARLLAALRRGAADELAAVIADDAEIDAWRRQLDDQAIALIARLQPLARDLRVIVAAQRVARELERVGDHVKRMAKRLRQMQLPLPAEIVSRLQWIGGQAQSLLSQAVEAFQRSDAAGAERAWADDAELDRMYRGLIAELLARMQKEPIWVETGVGLVMVAKSLERIGDHATNIAEEARCVAIGERPPGDRRG
ncbi:MAG: phosphate signaling complex protein PhoU [Gammaproteobacteria bacterium]|nr:phosphate signaling complex protein PhoU [Gammaproteobacteria bacterium]